MTREEIKERIIAIIDNYTTDMERCRNYQENYGVCKADYVLIAADICKEFEVIG